MSCKFGNIKLLFGYHFQLRERKMQSFEVEYTDLFSGEANYSWVKRSEICPKKSSRLAIVRAAKKSLGLQNCGGKVSDYGDIIEIRFQGTIAFITPKSEGSY